MKTVTVVTLATVSLALLGAASFKAFTLNPVDEAGLQPGFEVFRASLISAVQQKNVSALMELVAPEVRVGHIPGQTGVAAFRARWQLDQSPAESPLWAPLGRVLALGGAFEGETFVAPYDHAKWPAEFDRTEYGAITGTNVNVRGRAALDAPVVRQSSHQIVRFVWDSFSAPPAATVGGETWPWVKVALPGGQVGFVWGKFFHGGLDYHAEFQQTDGAWKLTAFYAGP